MTHATQQSDTTLFTPSSTPLKPIHRSQGSQGSLQDACLTLPDSDSSTSANSSPRSMPGTYHSDTSVGPQLQAAAAAKTGVPPMPTLRDRVRATVSDMQASTQHSAQAALRQAAAAAEALAVIESLTAQLERQKHGQDLADAALEGAADEHAELKDIISDLHQQLKLEQQERSGVRRVLDAQAAEVRLLQERLQSEVARADTLQDTVQQQGGEIVRLRAFELDACASKSIDDDGQTEVARALTAERLERESLEAAKLKLQKQLAGMIAAEHDLEAHLHAAHEEIEQQMLAMRHEVKEGRRARESLKGRKDKAAAEARELRARCTAQQVQLGTARVQIQELRAQVATLQEEVREERKRKCLAPPLNLSSAAPSVAALTARSRGSGGGGGGGGIAARQALAQVTALVDSMQNAGSARPPLSARSARGCGGGATTRVAARKVPEQSSWTVTPRHLVPPEACGPLDSGAAGRSMSLQLALERRSLQPVEQGDGRRQSST